MRSHSREPTLTLRGVHPRLLRCRCPYPTDSHSRVPRAAQRGDHREQLLRRSLDPTAADAREPTLKPIEIRSGRPTSKGPNIWECHQLTTSTAPSRTLSHLHAAEHSFLTTAQPTHLFTPLSEPERHRDLPPQLSLTTLRTLGCESRPSMLETLHKFTYQRGRIKAFLSRCLWLTRQFSKCIDVSSLRLQILRLPEYHGGWS